MWILYNLAHKFTKIRSMDGEAWIRVLGFFLKKEDAWKHAKKYAQYDNIEIRIAPQNQFKVMLQYDYNLKNLKQVQELETKKYYSLHDLHKERRTLAFKETMENAKNHVVGSLTSSFSNDSTDFETLESHESFTKITSTSDGDIKSVDASMTIRMQNFCSIAIIPDYIHSNQQIKQFEDWERKRLLLFSSYRNEKVHEHNYKLCVSSLMKDWVATNMPPNNANIYGQKMETQDQLFQNIPLNESHLKYKKEQEEFKEKNMKDSNFICWSNLFHQELDRRIWKELHVSEEQLDTLYNEWLEKNPCPKDENGAEPMVAFLNVANTEDEMKKNIQDDTEFNNYDIGCIAMYEWVKIKNAWSDDVKKTYREKTVAELHEKIAFQKKQAELLKEKNKDVKLIEVT